MAGIQSMNPAISLYWHNGVLGSWQNNNLNLMTHSLHYGSSIFEGIASYNGKVFKGLEHYDRFHQSAAANEIILSYSAKELTEATQNLVDNLKINKGYIRALAWLGEEDTQIVGRNCEVNVAIMAWERLHAKAFEQKMKGMRLIFGRYLKPTPDMALVNSKSASLYATARLVKLQAMKNGFDDGIMLDVNGNISELSGANIFFCRNNEIHTPTVNFCLNGITRLEVIEIAKKNGIKVIERDISPFELAEFDEAIATGTAMEIVRISEIDYKSLDDLYLNSSNVKQKHMAYQQNSKSSVFFNGTKLSSQLISSYEQIIKA